MSAYVHTTSSLAIVVALIATALIANAGMANAQTAAPATSSTRANPAPWRPSFTPFQSSPASNSATERNSSVQATHSSGVWQNRGLAQPSEALAKPSEALAKPSEALAQPNGILAQPTNQPAASPSNINQPGPQRVPATFSSNPNDGRSPNTGRLPNTGRSPSDVRSLNDARSGVSPAARRNAQLPGVTRVSKTMSELPNSAGQVWREYDISPYTSKITSTSEPEKAVLDWVLRETGKEMWFTKPMGILNVDKNKIFVYHTPEIQTVVKSIVDRFVRTKGQVQTFDVNLVTVTKPNWRSQAYTMLQPIDVKSPGVEAWLVSKENAAILMGQLSRRSDFTKHSSGRLTNHDGQSFALDKTRPIQFIRNLRWTPNQTPNYQPLMTTLDEGYKLQISCLTTLDNASIEAAIKCDVDQVEKLNNVKVTVPSPAGNQQINLQVPQLSSWRLHERFRWPSDEVLVLSCGVVASPEAGKTGGLPIPGLNKPKRADALLFIDYRGPASGATIPETASANSNRAMGRIK